MGLDGVELIFAIEEEFGVDIPESAAEYMSTVGDIYEWLKLKIASESPIALEKDAEEEIWNRLVRVFVRQLNLNPEDIKPHASITRDLGVD
ncbi:MAG: hypothetical protein AB7W16_09270 [Candidatus Obscuribacterales bacterium]